MTSPGAKIESKGKFSPIWGILLSIVFVSVLLAILVAFGVHEKLVDLMEFISDQGVWAAVLFILLMALTVVFLLPGIFFTTGAGFIFGVVEGTFYVVIGTTLGAGIAFLVARYLLGERAKAYVWSHNRLRVVQGEMENRTFTVVLLFRLIPFFPSKLSNYVFGLSNFNFRDFLLGSLIGFIPFSLHNVYLGSIAGDLMSLFNGESQRSGLEWILYGTGFIVTILTLLYLNHLARKALNEYSDSEKGEIP